MEAAVSLAAGALAGSVALVSFGLDSVIEVASAIILLWRLQPAMDRARREAVERKAHQLVGTCFLLLAAYVAIESSRALWLHAVPERSIPGIAIACAAVLVMPLLGRAKRKLATELGSGALTFRFATGRFLRIPFGYSPGGRGLELAAGLVVGRSCSRAGNGPHHRQRRSAGSAGQSLRRLLLVPLINHRGTEAQKIAGGRFAVISAVSLRKGRPTPEGCTFRSEF